MHNALAFFHSHFDMCYQKPDDVWRVRACVEYGEIPWC